jgi:hypothetical protein
MENMIVYRTVFALPISPVTFSHHLLATRAADLTIRCIPNPVIMREHWDLA